MHEQQGVFCKTALLWKKKLHGLKLDLARVAHIGPSPSEPGGAWCSAGRPWRSWALLALAGPAVNASSGAGELLSYLKKSENRQRQVQGDRILGRREAD